MYRPNRGLGFQSLAERLAPSSKLVQWDGPFGDLRDRRGGAFTCQIRLLIGQLVLPDLERRINGSIILSQVHTNAVLKTPNIVHRIWLLIKCIPY